MKSGSHALRRFRKDGIEHVVDMVLHRNCAELVTFQSLPCGGMGGGAGAGVADAQNRPVSGRCLPLLLSGQVDEIQAVHHQRLVSSFVGRAFFPPDPEKFGCGGFKGGASGVNRADFMKMRTIIAFLDFPRSATEFAVPLNRAKGCRHGIFELDPLRFVRRNGYLCVWRP